MLTKAGGGHSYEVNVLDNDTEENATAAAANARFKMPYMDETAS